MRLGQQQPATNPRAVLLDVASQETPEALVELIERHNSKNDAFDVLEVLQTLSRKQHEKLWEGLKNLSDSAIMMASPDPDKTDEQQAEHFISMLACLQAVATVALCALSFDKPVVPGLFLETAVLLHGIMMCLPEESQKLQTSIAQVCETWFLNDFEGKEELITNTLPFYVIRSLAKGTASDVKHVWGLRQALLLIDFEDESSSSLKQLLHQCMIHPIYLRQEEASDVKHVWGLRQALLLIDFEDESSSSLKQLLHQCMIHPIYLRQEEGHRFLSFLFGMHPELTKELHKTIKNQIPVCSVSALTSYGEIYFRAWRVAAEPYLGTLEKECIQDLMYAAVHAQRLGALSMSSRLRKVLGYFHQGTCEHLLLSCQGAGTIDFYIRKLVSIYILLLYVLGYFHMQKKQKGVDEALVRLYQPILWRAFKVANPLVRANAAAILVDAFPLQNPDANNEEIDALLQKQFDLLQELLEDPSPIVRATGVHGVCRIAGVFWELIPVHTVKSLITRLITSVAFDATSSSVRVAVFQGLKFLVENHLSHPLLKNLLGSLRDLVHDTSEKVRAAFVDLLLLVKGMKAIKFWTIVPLDHLLARLEVESSAPVMRKLVKLLMNSFHPLNKEPDVQVTRCSALWEANPMAARRFYQYAHLHAPIAATGKFILLLGRCLFQWAQSNANDTTVNGEDTAENKENEGVDEASEAMLTIPDADTIAGMLETIAISWAGIKDQLDKSANDSTKAKLVHLFAKALPRLLEPAESARARTAIIFIAGNLPSSSLPNFSKKCLKTLSSLKEGVNNQEFGPMLDCMCSWGKTALVLDMIATSLSENFANHLLVPSGKEARTDSRTCELEATVALDYLAWLLYEPVCRTAMLEYREKLKEISTSLKKVMEMIESSRSSDRNEIYPKALETLCHLEIHLSSKENKETATDSEPLTDLLMWSRRVLVPAWDIYSSSETSADALAETEGEKRQRDDDNETADMARQCLEIILSSCGEMVKLGVASEAMCDQLASLIKSISQLVAIDRFLSLYLHLRYPAIVTCQKACYACVAMWVFLASLLGVWFVREASVFRIIASTAIGAKSLPLLPQMAGIMYQVSQRANYREQGERLTDHTQGILSDILRTVSTNSNAENITQVLLGIRASLSEVLKSYERKRRAVDAGFVERPQIMATVLAASIAELSDKTENGLPSPDAIPPLSSFVINVITKSRVLVRSFVEEMEHCVSSGVLQDAPSLSAVVILLAATVNGNIHLDHFKSCALKVQKQMELLSDQTTDDTSERIIVAAKSLLKLTTDKLGLVS
ncbi:predicted protein [Nematostella vectensis]|uniref:Condensin-2 complex subunit G2 n=1 Tax=Nematostella vectensis TaxID=45351 RepID=A7RGR0_NEMVE|nr:predicted protein [Nematostella vectensis]|eukprot:XP_001641648.1 predicted protein [Nematostella vectensis]